MLTPSVRISYFITDRYAQARRDADSPRKPQTSGLRRNVRSSPYSCRLHVVPVESKIERIFVPAWEWLNISEMLNNDQYEELRFETLNYREREITRSGLSPQYKPAAFSNQKQVGRANC